MVEKVERLLPFASEKIDAVEGAHGDQVLFWVDPNDAKPYHARDAVAGSTPELPEPRRPELHQASFLTMRKVLEQIVRKRH